MTSPHAFLRSETRALHERAESAFARFDLTGAQGYGDFLQAQAAALLPLEAALDDAGAARLLPDWPARRRAPDLSADLAALGRASPPPLPTPAFANDGEAMGALYVLEGSKLGARHLLARLADAPPPSGATRFLAGAERPERQGQWPAFLARLDAAPYGQADLLTGAARAVAQVERAPVHVAIDSVKARS
ncbi:MAG: biliverdin-producing heme oxygenase [Alphaproteobacteria bacterium]